MCKAGDAAEWSFQRARLPKGTHTVPQHRSEAWARNGTELAWLKFRSGRDVSCLGLRCVFFRGWFGTIDPSGVYFDIANLAVVRKHNEFCHVFTFKYGH